MEYQYSKSMIQSMELYLSGKVAYHTENLKVYFTNPAGIGEHSNIMDAIEVELASVAEYTEKLSTLRGLRNDLIDG